MPRRIDHLVIAVRDLDAAGRFYERLGFQVGARNRHPWGTENRLVQFRASFLELIAVGEDAAMSTPWRAPSASALSCAIISTGAKVWPCWCSTARMRRPTRRCFAREGIGDFEPFFFERQRPQAGRQRNRRSRLRWLSPVHPNAPRAGFFVCQQHFPENFWNAAFQRHPNGATRICVGGSGGA